MEWQDSVNALNEYQTSNVEERANGNLVRYIEDTRIKLGRWLDANQRGGYIRDAADNEAFTHPKTELLRKHRASCRKRGEYPLPTELIPGINVIIVVKGSLGKVI